jgi:hypothetical protein
LAKLAHINQRITMTKIALIRNVNEKKEDPLSLSLLSNTLLPALLIPDHADDAVSWTFSTISGIIPDFTILAFADNPLFTVVSLLGFVRFVNLNSGRDISVYTGAIIYYSGNIL